MNAGPVARMRVPVCLLVKPVLSPLGWVGCSTDNLVGSVMEAPVRNKELKRALLNCLSFLIDLDVKDRDGSYLEFFERWNTFAKYHLKVLLDWASPLDFPAINVSTSFVECQFHQTLLEIVPWWPTNLSLLPFRFHSRSFSNSRKGITFSGKTFLLSPLYSI